MSTTNDRFQCTGCGCECPVGSGCGCNCPCCDHYAFAALPETKVT